MAAASRDKWCDAQMYITSRFLTSGTTITVNPGKCSKRAVRRCSVKETGILKGSAVTHTHTHRAFWLMDMWFQHWHGCQDAESFSWRREKELCSFVLLFGTIFNLCGLKQCQRKRSNFCFLSYIPLQLTQWQCVSPLKLTALSTPVSSIIKRRRGSRRVPAYNSIDYWSMTLWLFMVYI